MPAIKRIVVTKGGKVNLGDYQNADRSVTVEAELLPGEDEFAAFDAVSEKAREWLALEIRELVENQLDTSGLLGADEAAIRRRMRYAKGFAYLHSVDPDEADALVADMVSELASKEAPEVIHVSDDPLSPDYVGLDDDQPEFDPDEDDEGYPDDEEDEPAYDDDWDDEDLSLEDDEPEFDDDGASYDDPEPDDDDTLEEVVLEVEPDEDPAAALPESTDVPNAGLN